MKALSIRQPWAWAIMEAGKDIENRNWPTSFRGRIAVHAAKGMTRDEYDQFYFYIRNTEGMWNAIESLPPFEKLVRGAIVGTVEIADCVSQSDSKWFLGSYGLVLCDPQPLAKPIPINGALGLWSVPDELLEQTLSPKPERAERD